MFTRDDIAPLSAAAGSALAIGLALGLWLALPSWTGPAAAEAGPADQVDPNLAAYRRMLIENGVGAAPQILAVGYAPAPHMAAVEAPPTGENDSPPAADETETLTSGQAPEDARQTILAPSPPPVLQPSVDPVQGPAGSP